MHDPSEVRELKAAVMAQVATVVVGQTDALDAMVVALLAGGHALLEGVPGTAKTLMVRAFAQSLGLSFNRIQFTPDLMPSDVTGTNVFDLKSSAFHLARGPVFTEILLADEINRAPAKTQSALLEAMQERQVSIDGTRHALSSYFTVFATQNPIEQEGTYPLPEAQLDRFLFKLVIDYPSADEEDRILAAVSADAGTRNLLAQQLSPVMTQQDIDAARSLAATVHVEDNVRGYIRDLMRATRSSPLIHVGAGPRAGVHLLVAARWVALLDGRLFVTPDDVQRVLHPVVCHRLLLSPEMALDGISPAVVLDRIAATVSVPR